MSLNNIAMIMAPNLFSVQSSSRKKTTLNYSELHIAAGTCNIMRMLVKYHQILWVVSGFSATQKIIEKMGGGGVLVKWGQLVHFFFWSLFLVAKMTSLKMLLKFHINLFFFNFFFFFFKNNFGKRFSVVFKNFLAKF